MVVLEQQYRATNKRQVTQTVELTENLNYAINNQAISEEDDEEESKVSFTSSQQEKRSKDRISCTYRELAKYQRTQLGIIVGSDSRSEDLNSSVDSSSIGPVRNGRVA